MRTNIVLDDSLVAKAFYANVKTKKELINLAIFQPLEEIETYEKAAKLYFNCRQEGVTIRSTIDCLIAPIAIEHKLTLIHSDKDYERIATMAPLKLA